MEYSEKEFNEIILILTLNKVRAKKLYKLFPNKIYPNIKEDFVNGLLTDKEIKKIVKLLPKVFKINGKLFLQNHKIKSKVHRFDDVHIIKLIEMMDISTEIESGESVSFYVDSTTFFEKASIEEIKKVAEFLTL